MKKICLVLATLAASLVMGADPAVEENVLVLTDANIDEQIAKHEYILVEFYAPWCGHCKNLAPEYAKAAKKLSEGNPPIPLGKVDATVEKKAAEKFKVQGYPTLYFFKNGKQMEYTGGRDEQGIVNWIMKKTGPPSTKVTCDELKKKVEDNKLVLTYFGDASAAQFKVFEETATSSQVGEKYQFFHSEDKECATSHGAKELPGVVLFRKFDNSPLVFSGALENPALTNFASENSVPTLINFSEDYIEPIFGNKKQAIFLFLAKDKQGEEYFKTFEKAAHELKGQILFSHSDVVGGIQERLADFIGVTSNDIPTLRILDPAQDMKKFTYGGKVEGMTVEDIKKFVDDFKAGNLKPFLKSEEPPAEQGDVKVVVGKQFKEMVIDNDNDVLIKFYAPWCGHCKKLAPIWDDLGKELKDVKGLVIAKFDATTNEAEGVDIRGYPTLKFYPKGSKSAPIDYEGDRGKTDDFKNWLKEKSTAYKSHLEGKAEL